MSRVLSISRESVIPSSESVWRALSVPEDSGENERLQNLTQQALETYQRLTSPSGILAEISIDDFKAIFDDDSDPDSPFGTIYPSMNRLALFAVTLGKPITEEVSALFDKREFALATLLDAVASEGCELAASIAEQEYVHSIRNSCEAIPSPAVARFSPGYCGWNITSQRELFRYLLPHSIGIELFGSCLMNPLKSISGVIAVGSKEILENGMSQPVCLICETKSCSDRITLISEFQSQSL